MRGCKTYGGQPIKAGAIIYRQLGTKVGLTAAEMSSYWSEASSVGQELASANLLWSRLSKAGNCAVASG